jgi:sn-glycerol 3-phosphate transport system permease protein
MPADAGPTVDESPPAAAAAGPADGGASAAPETPGAPASPRRRGGVTRIASLAGQYLLLCLLALVVLVPLAFAGIQALSPPVKYVAAGHPFHPVAVDWKDRTWLSGGFVSVASRTVLVVVALGWLQLRMAGGRARDLALLAAPRRLFAVVGGTVVFAVGANAIWAASLERSPSTPWRWAAAVVAVAATQLVGFLRPRRWVRDVAIALSTSLGLMALVVVAFGAAAWNQGFDAVHLGPAMNRSLQVTVMITTLQVVTSVFAAYAFAFLRFPCRTLLFAVYMGTLLLPLEVTLLANVQTIRQLDLINSNTALVAPFAATAFGTFLIRQGFRGLPPELHDATRLDGYGHMRFLWGFAVPLTRPVIASFTVIAAMGAWQQYLWPQAVIDDSSSQTAQIRLRSAVALDPGSYNIGVAAAIVVAVPVVLLLIAFNRQIIRGLTTGAVKG